MLKLLFITNNPQIAVVAEKAGVNRIWIDLETLGKAQRQKNMNTVLSRHSINDIERISPLLSQADMLVRINPWNSRSKQEIDQVIESGADIIMLPYWKTPEEVESFISYVHNRCKTLLLLETRKGVECLHEVLEIPFIDEFHIGLNDLSISYGYHDMFEPFVNGLLDEISSLINKVNIPFGIGGIGQFGLGLSPSPEELIAEHYRLGSTAVILSRTFCNVEKLRDMQIIEETLNRNIAKLRETEKWALSLNQQEMKANHERVINAFSR